MNLNHSSYSGNSEFIFQKHIIKFLKVVGIFLIGLGLMCLLPKKLKLKDKNMIANFKFLQ